MSENDIVIKIERIKKRYRLGTIGGGTLRGDIESWWARKRGKEDPNSIIGTKSHTKNEIFFALDGIDLNVHKGERLGIIGHNGAGKSTLLKLLSRVTAPTEGKIFIDGRISSMLEVGTGFNGELTGRENIYLNGAILGMTKAEVDEKMERIIDFSECRQFIDTPVKRYSSGMYVKLAFSVAAHLDSEILIMDEVLAVGDVQFQKKCLNKMSEVSHTEGRTILYVSHNMSTIRQLCDRCIVLDKGRIVFDGDVDEAIGVYSHVQRDFSITSFNLRNEYRAYKDYGKRILLTELTFIDKKIAAFERIEPLRFSLTFDALDDVDELKLYFVLISINGERIGTTQTYNSFLNAKRGKTYTVAFSFDISNIAVGKYYFQPDIFWTDIEGMHHSLDHPVKGISFEIVDTHKKGIKWQSYFSHIILNELKVIEK